MAAKILAKMTSTEVQTLGRNIAAMRAHVRQERMRNQYSQSSCLITH